MPKILEALRARNAERRALNEATEGEDTRDEYAIILESICGATDDSQPVEQYDGTLGVPRAFVDANQRAVGQIQWNDNLASIFTNPGNVNGARWCSGTLISNDLFLTAGHCFDQTGGGWNRPRVNGTSNIISSVQIAQNMHVNFNFQVDPAGNPRPVSVFPIIDLIEYRLGGLDFAIVRLGGNPGATWGATPISTTDAAAGDMLCIMGHPVGVPKRIEAGPALAPSGNQIRYDNIDTQGGNSGSGVLRASDGRIVGVHTNGGCGPASPGDSNFNFGMRIAAVIAASPTLQSLTRPPISTSLAADVHVTIRAADSPVATISALDISTSIARDFATIRALDQGGTLAALDQGGSLKFRDDVKIPALDKNPSADVIGKGFARDPIGDPFGRIGNPVVNPGRFGPSERPFVLANPHHSMAWAGEAQGGGGSGLEDYEATLAQLHELMTQYQEALQAIGAQYEALLAEYQQAGGQTA